MMMGGTGPLDAVMPRATPAPTGVPISSQLIQDWVRANPQPAAAPPVAQFDPRRALAQMMTRRRLGQHNAADPNPDTINRPFSDLGPFLGHLVRREFSQLSAGEGGYGDGGRRGATDSHGQVRGGGTGSRGGGLTAGGPR